MTADVSFPHIDLLPLLLSAFLVWLAGIAGYRVFFHPLANIPGPLLARLTHFYIFFFNVGKPGRLYLQIEKLHQKYGPVVRISPNEIHLSDPDNYDKIYYVGSKFWKSPNFYGNLGVKTAAVTTLRNEVHRVRRAAINPLFSRKVVLDLEGVVQSKVQKLCQLLSDKLKVGEPMDLHHGFRAVSIDVITDYAFDNCFDLLESPTLGRNEFFDLLRGLVPSFWIFQQFPFLQKLSAMLPPWLLIRMSPEMSKLIQLQLEIRNQVLAVKSKMDANKGENPSRLTIFNQLLDPNVTEGHIVPSVDDLKDEAFSIVTAASDTTGNTMTIAAYNIISNKSIYHKLVAELEAYFPTASNQLDYLILEKLPYLTAVIKESLRLSYGVIGRLPRVVPEHGAVFNGYDVPCGVDVSMSSWMMHRNTSIFPNPDEFDPERWLEPKPDKKLEKYLVVFSRGSRQCVGMHLAYCELYVTLGTLFRRFDKLEVYNTSPEDLVYDDYFSPFHPVDARKFHVVGEISL